MTRALVVDDSQFMRTVIGNALADAGYDVETAANGREALEAVDAFEPDVVTMDVKMPEMDGIEAVERIMTTDPVPILMLSAYTEEGADATFDALESGAVDFLEKPDGSGSRNIGHLATEVVEKVTELANADISSLAVARTAATANATAAVRADRAAASGPDSGGSVAARGDAGPGDGPSKAESTGPQSRSNWRPDPDSSNSSADRAPVTVDGRPEDGDAPTVVVGASTGGPRIVERLFERLPAALEASVLVVQHMPAAFTDRFADRLDAAGEYAVREATDGDRVGPGEAVVAPGDAHLEVTGDLGRSIGLSLTDDDHVHGVRPSIDVTMQSVADRISGPLCGVVLSGMGQDGAAGIEALDAAGGYTIAQDETTSPVFGIPCQAIKTGCIDEIAPADEIVDGIVDACTVDAVDENTGGDT
ncbi:chemotaxis response regulator protein-glutamate methylesterase [Halobiforma lacisalsi AJ5]|uniref:Protein-glutamate methylesterase/protein-glutamine glutaminase n=1 Tax=Natronobacterium lacisalsi AJ5 TaxID=358396 RepID=M0LTW7_NATLA|nr:chemotaxis-specific protein-glutamate methyltransferase CheB [Halobiforma lacisalsi]APW99683.1 chemotaxis response regulator protein-glutamate methylesterase [Halobiforma lacisalsi AJ5]EMA35525.1 chemotaxis-specific methylesterase [Halobiforma lacisalsi AJ5]